MFTKYATLLSQMLNKQVTTNKPYCTLLEFYTINGI